MSRVGGNSKSQGQSVNSSPQSTLAEMKAPELCANSVLDVVPLVNRFMRSQVSRHLKSASSMAQVRTLAYLTRRPGASLSELADHLCVTKATASATVERMVQHGLVDRSEDPKERRCVVLTITGDGAIHLKKAREVAMSAVAEILAGLPDSKLQAITEGLNVLREAFNELEHRHEG